FAVRVLLFRISSHIAKAPHTEPRPLIFLFVEVDPANVLFSPLIGERLIDNDGAQPGYEATLPAELAYVSEGAKHRFLNQVVGFICIRGITSRKAVQHSLVTAEQLAQSTGLSILGCNNEFFIAALPAVTCYVLEHSSRTQFARERRLRLECQLHRILHMRPKSALS